MKDFKTDFARITTEARSRLSEMRSKMRFDHLIHSRFLETLRPHPAAKTEPFDLGEQWNGDAWEKPQSPSDSEPSSLTPAPDESR
jgi:hypothetical protein